jgi:two-component system chemotaxis sensor kinase CheA
VEAAGRVVALPLHAVLETRRIAPADRARTTDGETIAYEGRSAPILPLADVLELTKAVGKRAASGPVEVSSAIVVQGASGIAVVEVDRLIGPRTLVSRPLPPLCPALDVVAGASLDVEGNPQLLLDPEALVVAARRRTIAPRLAAPPRSPILVIDDSLTTRMLERSILESAGYDVEVALVARGPTARGRGRGPRLRGQERVRSGRAPRAHPDAARSVRAPWT